MVEVRFEHETLSKTLLTKLVNIFKKISSTQKHICEVQIVRRGWSMKKGTYDQFIIFNFLKKSILLHICNIWIYLELIIIINIHINYMAKLLHIFFFMCISRIIIYIIKMHDQSCLDDFNMMCLVMHLCWLETDIRMTSTWSFVYALLSI